MTRLLRFLELFIQLSIFGYIQILFDGLFFHLVLALEDRHALLSGRGVCEDVGDKPVFA